MRYQVELIIILMKGIIFTILCFFLCIPLNAQQLYFVRATVENTLLFDSPPPVQIIAYKSQHDSLLRVYKDFTKITHTSSYCQLNDVSYYPSMEAFCFTNDNRKFFLLNINRPDTLVELIPQCPLGYDMPTDIGVIKNYWYYECYNHEALLRKDVLLYKGLDSALSNRFDVLPQNFKDLYITGKNALRIIIKPFDKHLYLPVVADTITRPTLSIELPQQYVVTKKKFLGLAVNDDQQTMITMGSERPRQDEKYGKHYGVIYNKNNRQWFEVELKGNGFNLMAYGTWLTGYICDVIDFDTKYVPDGKTSPGKAVRDSVNLPYQFKEWEINSGRKYLPGILYLLNTQTQKYIEWNTEQGDSEILLVQNEVVYYRVFDKIYKANIEKGEKLGIPELLVKDTNVVPFIHWAFICPN